MLGSILLFACEHPEQIKEDNKTGNLIISAVSHPERPKKDIKRDKIRSPDKILQFFDVKRGEKVAELLAAGGYYSELLSRCVGQTGQVYMHNNRKFYEFQTDRAVVERLDNNRLANVIRWDRELSNLGFSKNSLDKLFMILVLHDMFWMEEDIEPVINGIFEALKPGGILGIIDHTAKAGSGIEHAKEMRGLHRIDKGYVITLMQQHGFLFDGENHSLNNPLDDRSQSFFSPSLKDKPTDRFILKFRKPE